MYSFCFCLLLTKDLLIWSLKYIEVFIFWANNLLNITAWHLTPITKHMKYDPK